MSTFVNVVAIIEKSSISSSIFFNPLNKWF